MKTILVVDDDQITAKLVSRVIQNSGYEVLSFNDPMLALEHLVREKPADLLVTDMDMPELDGSELICGLKGMSHTAPMPVIMISARQHELETRYKPSFFLPKPVDTSRLLQCITQLI